MTGRELARCEAALRMLSQGRAEEAREKLADVVREAGGEVPRLPISARVEPAAGTVTA